MELGTLQCPFEEERITHLLKYLTYSRKFRGRLDSEVVVKETQSYSPLAAQHVGTVPLPGLVGSLHFAGRS